MDPVYDKQVSDPTHKRVGDHARYMMDRLINVGMGATEAMAVLKYTVDDRVTEEMYEARIAERERLRVHVEALPKGIEQRTPAWYAAREGLITASNFYKAAAKPEQFIKEKLAAKPFLGSDATRWGVKYEEVSNMLYAYYNHTTVLEYGLLPHPTIAHLGASPDGITPYGVLVEYKNPYSKTLKDIPEEYWGQCLGQMEVCKLTECDFVVCRVRELSKEACREAMATARDPARYGAVATLPDKSFLFSKPGDSFDDLVAFAELNRDYDVTFHHAYELTVTRVTKNEEAWADMERRLARTWDMMRDAKEGKGFVAAPEAPAFPFKLF